MSITSKFLENISGGESSITEQFRRNIGDDIELPVAGTSSGMTDTKKSAKPLGPKRVEQAKAIGRYLKESVAPFKPEFMGVNLKSLVKGKVGLFESDKKVGLLPNLRTLSESIDTAFTPITAPLTIPLNLIVAVGKRDKSRLKAIGRILTLQPKQGDSIFVGDVLKEFGITDESTRLPEGTIDRIGLVGDFKGFSLVNKLTKIVTKAIASKNVPKTFRQGIETEVKKAKITKFKKPVEEKLIPQTLKSEAGFARIAKGKAPKPKLVPIHGKQAKDVQRKIVEQKFRQDKLNLPDEQLEQVNRRLDILGLKRRQQMSLGEMERVAMDAGVTPELLLNDTAGRIITRDQVIQLRNLQNNLATRITDLEKSKLIPENMLKVKPIDKEISKLTNQLDKALTNFVAGNNEIGRAAVANRILAQKTLDPGVWLSKAKKLLGKKLDEERLNEVTKVIMDMIGKKDVNALATFIANLKEPSNLEKMIILWKSGLLTSPTTQFANLQGNISMAVLETAKDIPATGLDVLIALGSRTFGGKGLRTTTTSPTVILQKMKGIKTGWKEGVSYFRTGTYSTNLMIKYDLPRSINFKNKYLNTYVQSVLRSLGANDIFFREIAMMESLAKQARVIAKNELIKGVIKKAQVKGRIRELLIGPTVEMGNNAINVAERATFQNKNVIADMIAAGRRKALARGDISGNIALAGTELVAPFVRTPTNIAARILDFSPAGFVRAVFKVARPSTKRQEMFVNDMGRAITGTSIIALGAYMASKGLMTGNAPQSKTEREQFFAEGKNPNSFLAHNMWWQLSRISPVGNLLVLGAEYHNQSLEKEGFDLIVGTTFGGVKALTEQTFLKGMSGALKAINDPDRSAATYVYQSVGSIVPSIIGRTARSIDPISRKPETLFESILTRLPFASKSVTPRRDNFGNKVKVGGGRLNLVDPFNTKDVNPHPVLIEARKIGVPIGLPSQIISGTKLTNSEYSKYQRLQGTVLELSLSELLGNAQYQKLDVVGRAKEFEKMTRAVRTYTNDTIFPALMINRYNLPEEINPKILRSVIAQLNENDKFKNSNKGKQRRIILKFLGQ